MGYKRKIISIGNSFGIIIPKTILELYNLKVGDNLELSQKDHNLIFAKVDGIHVKNKKVRRKSGASAK